jgi:hypothetical protein
MSKRHAVARITLASLLLSGCATELTFRRREALDYFVGKDQAFVLARLGPPARTVQSNGAALLVYDQHAEIWVPGTPLVRNDLGLPINPYVYRATCTTTFRVAAGRVDAWRLDGDNCRASQFPMEAADMTTILADARADGVNRMAQFPIDSFTARSTVNYGEFHSN